MTDLLPSISVATLENPRIVDWKQLRGSRAAPIRIRPPYLPAHSFYHPYFQWSQHPSVQVAIATVRDAILCVGHGDSGMVILNSGEAVREQSMFAKSFSKGEWSRPAAPDSTLEAAYVAFDARWFNYYHLLCCTAARLQIAKDAEILDVPLVVPRFDVAEEERKAVTKDTYFSVINSSGLSRNVTFLSEGRYLVKYLYLPIILPESESRAGARWDHLIPQKTEFGMPNVASSITDISELGSFYNIFDKIKAKVLNGQRKQFRKRPIYLDRADSRISQTMRTQILGNLSKFGIERVLLENLSFEDQILCMSRASAIISPHGAGLSNLLFADPGTQVFEILQKIPTEVVYRPYFYQLASGRGLPYSALDPTGVRDIAEQLADIFA